MSDEFIAALRFTSKTARDLGLRFDLTLGSGWPYGGPTVPITEAAGRRRVERANVPENVRPIPLPSIGAGEQLLAIFAARTEGKSIAPDTLREITDIRDGAFLLPEGAIGAWQVQFFIASRTGMQVKRPAIGGEGFVLDHPDRTAVDDYLNRVGGRLMQAFDATPPHAVFCDSLEVYNSDWTGDFLEEFQKRRGYDLKAHLTALANDIGQKSLSIRHDWGQTLTELLNERFLQPLHDWSHKNKTLLRIQCYGTPAAALSSNAYADLSEGEGHRWKSLSATRWASSANHLFGRPVTSSETWTWLHSPSFRATPLDLKAEADLHFLQGVNQLIGHGWPLKPDVGLSPATPDIGFIHRATSYGDIYFVANTSNQHQRAKATFRVEGPNPEWWDAMTGEVRTAAVIDRSANGVSVSLDLEPYGSRVLVFSRRARSPLASATGEGPVPIDLSQGWQVSFGGTGASVTMSTLSSWADDEKTRYYSGLASYEKTFVLPDGYLKKGMGVRLDFGEGNPVATPAKPSANGMRALLDGPVREAAVITVNGRRAGSVWCPPYVIDSHRLSQSWREQVANRRGQYGDQLYGRARAARLPGVESSLRRALSAAGHGQSAAGAIRADR